MINTEDRLNTFISGLLEAGWERSGVVENAAEGFKNVNSMHEKVYTSSTLSKNNVYVYNVAANSTFKQMEQFVNGVMIAGGRLKFATFIMCQNHFEVHYLSFFRETDEETVLEVFNSLVVKNVLEG